MVVDGEFFPENPIEALRKGNFKRDLNLLASTVEDEGSFVINFKNRDLRFHKDLPEKITLEEAQDKLALLTRSYADKDIDTDGVNRFYFNGFTQHTPANLLRKTVGVAYGDLILACPTLYFAKQAFKASPETVQVYQWHYTAKHGHEKLLCGAWMGACHLDEVYPIFGMAFRYREEFTTRERENSLNMMQVLGEFVKTG